jgi:hypothetical protein
MTQKKMTEKMPSNITISNRKKSSRLHTRVKNKKKSKKSKTIHSYNAYHNDNTQNDNTQNDHTQNDTQNDTQNNSTNSNSTESNTYDPTDTNFNVISISISNSKSKGKNKSNISKIPKNTVYTKNKKYKTFLTKLKTITRHKSKFIKSRKINRSSQEQDKISEFIDDTIYKLKKGNIIKGSILTTYFFNDEKINCVCENIYDIQKDDTCKCNSMKTYSSQGRSGASIHSIKCATVQNVLKVLPLDIYYMKMRTETNNYIFLELDGFTIQTIINSYIYKLLPHNSVNIVNSGVCKKEEYKKYIKASGTTRKGDYHGYNLMSEADLGSGRQFLLNLLEGKYDKEFGITNEDIRYSAVVSFLLQSILIIAHLQSSSLEFFHGDYKPDNVFVKRCKPTSLKYYKFNAFGNKIKIKNMGFAVLIADFDKSSMTISSNIKNRSGTNTIKYRLIPPLVAPLLLSKYVNYIIKEFGDVDPDIINDSYTIKINKVFISKFIPLGKDPTIHILRSAGIKLYRDFDIYTFMVKLLDDINVREYIILKKLDTTILSFMSKKFKEYIFNRLPKTKSLSETAYVIVDTFDKLNEPMTKIFTKDYFKILQNLNYHLFRKN